MSTEPRKPVVLAEETQDILTQDQIKREDLSINESFFQSQNDPGQTTNKRKLLDDSSEIAAKRQATGKNEDDEDSFNFVEEVTNVNAGKKLNLLRAPKRKASVDCDEEDLFNFHTETETQEKKSKIFDKNGDDQNVSVNKRPRLEEEQDIKPIRGIDLQKISALGTWKLCIKTEIKQESDATDELNNKLDSMNIGSSIVVIKDDLIKKEVVVVTEPLSSGVVNFKKFKKVWPLSMQGRSTA